MCVFTQQAFPRCYTIPGITAVGGLNTTAHTTHTHTLPPGPLSEVRREGRRFVGGRNGEIRDQREEGRSKGSVNSTVGRFFSSNPLLGLHRQAHRGRLSFFLMEYPDAF